MTCIMDGTKLPSTTTTTLILYQIICNTDSKQPNILTLLSFVHWVIHTPIVLVAIFQVNPR